MAETVGYTWADRTMMAKQRSARPSVAVKRPPRTDAALRPEEVPDEIAIRFQSGKERKLRSVLAPFGTLDIYPRQRMMVLRRAPGLSARTVRDALDGFQTQGLIEFTTPVLFDPGSQTRQVLTDEIVLRLKAGAATGVLAALKAAHGLEIGPCNEFDPTQYIVKVPNPSGLQTLDVARSLDRSDDVEFASPNYLTQIKR
jgi:hypothetical protein